jgi:Rrf2 family protein
VKVNRTTEYALLAAAEMALADGLPVTVGQVAERNRIPEGALAKVLQQLVRTGIAQGIRGVGGGYRLARPGRRITVQDVIDVFEPRPPQPGPDESSPGGEASARVRELFGEVDELVRCTFQSVTLETLVRWGSSRNDEQEAS